MNSLTLLHFDQTTIQSTHGRLAHRDRNRDVRARALHSCLNNLFILMILITIVVRPSCGPLCTIYLFGCVLVVSFTHHFQRNVGSNPCVYEWQWLNAPPDTDHCRWSFFVTMSFPIRNCRIFCLLEVLLCWFYCHTALVVLYSSVFFCILFYSSRFILHFLLDSLSVMFTLSRFMFTR